MSLPTPSTTMHLSRGAIDANDTPRVRNVTSSQMRRPKSIPFNLSRPCVIPLTQSRRQYDKNLIAEVFLQERHLTGDQIKAILDSGWTELNKIAAELETAKVSAA
jgi:hypothetical protein